MGISRKWRCVPLITCYPVTRDFSLSYPCWCNFNHLNEVLSARLLHCKVTFFSSFVINMYNERSNFDFINILYLSNFFQTKLDLNWRLLYWIVKTLEGKEIKWKRKRRSLTRTNMQRRRLSLSWANRHMVFVAGNLQNGSSWSSHPCVRASFWRWPGPSDWLLMNRIWQKWWVWLSRVSCKKTALSILSVLFPSLTDCSPGKASCWARVTRGQARQQPMSELCPHRHLHTFRWVHGPGLSVTAASWETLSRRHPAKPHLDSWPTEIIDVCSFSQLSFGVICYATIDSLIEPPYSEDISRYPSNKLWSGPEGFIPYLVHFHQGYIASLTPNTKHEALGVRDLKNILYKTTGTLFNL